MRPWYERYFTADYWTYADAEYTAAELYPGNASETDGVGAPVVNENS